MGPEAFLTFQAKINLASAYMENQDFLETVKLLEEMSKLLAPIGLNMLKVTTISK
jgi:hypothetical protein